MRKIRIAINTQDFCEWGGGVDFLRMLIKSLISVKPTNISLYLFIRTGNDDKFTLLQRLYKKIFPYQRSFNEMQLPKKYASLININDGVFKIFYQGNSLNKVLKRLKIDCILPVYPKKGNYTLKVPWIGYLYDFQHEYFPNFFSKENIIQRRSDFNTMLEQASVILLHSEHAKKDVNYFCLNLKKTELCALPIAPISDFTALGNSEFTAVANTYKLPQRYFLVANQFWRHKSHQTVFAALKLLDDATVAIVCTGLMSDPNDPTYVPSLIQYVKDLHLEERIIFLGHISKEDQLAIMQQALALIQPTLFEGAPGGGSANEALFFGTPIILSDIVVNKELKGRNIYFFQAGNSIDLAEKMDAVLKDLPVRIIDKNLMRAEMQERYAIQGEYLFKLINYVIYDQKNK